MSNDENLQNQDQDVSNEQTQTTEVDHSAEVERLQSELERARANLSKARAVENKVKQSKSELEQMLAEKSGYEEKYKALLEEVNTERINSTLSKKLEEMKAKDPSLLLDVIKREGLIGEDGKVIDDAVTERLSELKKKYPSQFDLLETPTPKRVAEGKELDVRSLLEKASTPEEVNQILKNHRHH